MVVSALVVTLPADPIRSLEVLVELGRDPRLIVGDPVRDRVPVVAETADAREGAALAERLAELPGVHVDVVAIDFGEDAPDADGPEAPRSTILRGCP